MLPFAPFYAQPVILLKLYFMAARFLIFWLLGYLTTSLLLIHHNTTSPHDHNTTSPLLIDYLTTINSPPRYLTTSLHLIDYLAT
jgi:hypothetical protein